MRPILDRINENETLVADGAMGTMLFQKGLKAGDCPERMNLDQPEILEEIARLYFEAGADIIQTNTFGASPLKLSQYSLDDKTEEINVNAVYAVRKVVDGKAYISASVGPCGRLLLPYKKFALSTPVCATMTFESTPKGFFTIMGVSIKQAVEGLIDAGTDIIGSNCGNGIDNMIKIAAEFRKHTSYPLLIQSNAGLPGLVNGVDIYPETPEFMAEKCKQLLECGVNIIGGCCGTTPDHIAAFRKIADEFNSL